MTAPGDALAVAVHLRVAASRLDLLSGVLWEAGVLGVEEVVPAEGSVGPLAEHQLVEVVATTADRDAADRVVDAVRASARSWSAERDDHAVEVVAVLDVVDDGWRDAWRRFAAAVRAGQHLVVVPAWLPPPDDLGSGDLVVRIDPGRAFGSGSHPSTRVALAALEQTVTPGDRVLDVGCGSGVLSVAAARLGAASVVAVDVDPEAVRATRHNADAGGVAPVVQASVTPVQELGDTFDVVVANIGVRTLVDLAPELVARVRPAGSLVLSGVLAERRGEIEVAFRAHGCVTVDQRVSDGWVALTLVPPAGG